MSRLWAPVTQEQSCAKRMGGLGDHESWYHTRKISRKQQLRRTVDEACGPMAKLAGGHRQ